MIDWEEVIAQAEREVRKQAEDSVTLGAWWLFDDEEES